tara:strand:+ start:5358 stop:6302 length:945 start_codon:yes stop_codon:yes gene_type:complete
MKREEAMVKIGVSASDELKVIGRLLTYKYRNWKGEQSDHFQDVVEMLNVTLNGESYTAESFNNSDAVGGLDSKDTERKTVRLCYGTDPEPFIVQVIDNLINTSGNERLKEWLNGLPGKAPTLTCSLNGLYTSKHSEDQTVHVDFPSATKSKYLTILFNFVCTTEIEETVGTLTTKKSTVFVDAENTQAAKRKSEQMQDTGEKQEMTEADGVAFDGNELHYGCGKFERIALLVVLNASSQTDENLDTKIANEMQCNWFKERGRLMRQKKDGVQVMQPKELVQKILMPYVTGAGSSRARFKWPRRVCSNFCVECLN